MESSEADKKTESKGIIILKEERKETATKSMTSLNEKHLRSVHGLSLL